MDEIYVIDAVNFLFRSYYAIGPMTNSQGESTSALYGFIRSIQKLIKLHSPKHLVCVFDGPNNKQSRRALFQDYKAHRQDAPLDLISQFDWAYEFCKLFGISIVCIDGFEADDTMASIALWAKNQGAKSYLCTSDKDLAQIVDESTFLMHPHKDYKLIDEEEVKKIFGVGPKHILDYLAIVGDTSDNIPGIQGFGPKTAASLLLEFGSLDQILQNPEKVKGAKKQETLKASREIALLSRKLATLHIDLDIPKDENFYEIKEQDNENLKKFYQEKNFNALLKEMEESKETCPLQETTYTLIETEEGLKKTLKELTNAKSICVDTETTSTSPFLAKLVGIGLSSHEGEGFYIPFNGNLSKDILLKELNSFFKNPSLSFFGHHLKYDLHVLEKHGFDLSQIDFDTLLASYILEPQNRKHGLDDLSLEKFGHKKIPIETLIGKGKKQISMEDVSLSQVSHYCSEDVDYTYRLKTLFKKDLQKKNLESIFYEIELPLLRILKKMESHGVYLDKNCLLLIKEKIEIEIEKEKKQIFSLANEEFNLNSPKQLSEMLFEKLQIEKPKKAKSAFATSADVLEELSLNYPIAKHILEYRTLEKLRSTYIEALPESIHPETGRIHCTFSQSTAATGRLASQNPNLQNIPVRSQIGNSIRGCFRPEKKGWSFIGADYSQIELRLLAHFSKDPELIKAFKEKEDIHAYTASLIYNLPITMITPEMRFSAKAVNFGIIYGQGAFGLSKQLGISMKEASSFIKTYFERYPKIKEFLDECKEKAKTLGYSETLEGRKRPIPEINNKNPMIRSGAERLAVNTPLQGTAADLIKKAMIGIDKKLKAINPQGFMILQIHDELIFEVPDDEIPLFEKLIREEMEGVYKLKVPLEVDIAVGKNWAEC